MPLRDAFALENWRQRAQPSDVLWEIVLRWVNGLHYAPYHPPSQVVAELSDQPNHEVRVATIPDSRGLEVFYLHDYVTDAIDLIWIG